MGGGDRRWCSQQTAGASEQKRKYGPLPCVPKQLFQLISPYIFISKTPWSPQSTVQSLYLEALCFSPMPLTCPLSCVPHVLDFISD